jgi:DNA-binding CsgD family transcriptional regulator
MRAAIARLTENEKECLRRRLLPQTAKEMAIELGVSPHAVEKRLKMARAKLGLSSSLQAARLLVQAESQVLVPHAPDLVPSADRLHVTLLPGDRRRWWILGGLTMISITIAVATIALAGSNALAPRVQDKAVGLPLGREAVATMLANSFDALDKDRSGFVEPGEVPVMILKPGKAGGPMVLQRKGGTTVPPAWFARADADHDGKLSRSEFSASGAMSLPQPGN